jgi:hypothetical protein
VEGEVLGEVEEVKDWIEKQTGIKDNITKVEG